VAAGLCRAFCLAPHDGGGEGEGEGGEGVATVLGLPLPSSVALWPCVPGPVLGRSLALVARLTLAASAALDLPLLYPLYPLARESKGGGNGSGHSGTNGGTHGGNHGGGGGGGGGGGSCGADDLTDDSDDSDGDDGVAVNRDYSDGISPSDTRWGWGLFGAPDAAAAGNGTAWAGGANGGENVSRARRPSRPCRCGAGVDAGFGWAAVEGPRAGRAYLLLPPVTNDPSDGSGGATNREPPARGFDNEVGSGDRSGRSWPERGADAFEEAVRLLQMDVLSLCLRAEVRSVKAG
jgi:hypothetical protein